VTNILGLSGRRSSGKTTTTNMLYALELCSQGYKARVDEKGNLKVVTNTETNEEGILNISDTRPEVQQFLDETVHPFIKQYSLADFLKYISINLFGLSFEQVYGTDEQKAQSTSIKWSDLAGVFCKDFKTKTKNIEKELGLEYHEDGFVSGRQFLQYFGSQVCRRIKNDCWTQFTLNRIQNENTELAVISDVRFKDEIEQIQKAGGKILRFTRSPFEDSHVSETELDNYEGFDAVIDNQNMSVGEQLDKVMDQLVTWKYFKQL